MFINYGRKDWIASSVGGGNETSRPTRKLHLGFWADPILIVLCDRHGPLAESHFSTRAFRAVC